MKRLLLIFLACIILFLPNLCAGEYQIVLDEEIQITDDPIMQTNPKVDGNLVAWLEKRGDYTTIKIYDLEQKQEHGVKRLESGKNGRLSSFKKGVLIFSEDSGYCNSHFAYDRINNRIEKIPFPTYSLEDPGKCGLRNFDGNYAILQGSSQLGSVQYIYDVRNNDFREFDEDVIFSELPFEYPWIFSAPSIPPVYLVNLATKEKEQLDFKDIEQGVSDGKVITKVRDSPDYYEYDIANKKLTKININKKVIRNELLNLEVVLVGSQIIRNYRYGEKDSDFDGKTLVRSVVNDIDPLQMEPNRDIVAFRVSIEDVIPEEEGEIKKLNLEGMTPEQVLDEHMAYSNWVGVTDQLNNIKLNKQLAGGSFLKLLEVGESYLEFTVSANSDLAKLCGESIQLPLKDVCIDALNRWETRNQKREILSKEKIEETPDTVKIKAQFKTTLDNTVNVTEQIEEYTYIFKKDNNIWKIYETIDKSGTLTSEKLEGKKQEYNQAIQKRKELYQEIKKELEKQQGTPKKSGGISAFWIIIIAVIIVSVICGVINGRKEKIDKKTLSTIGVLIWFFSIVFIIILNIGDVIGGGWTIVLFISSFIPIAILLHKEDEMKIIKEDIIREIFVKDTGQEPDKDLIDTISNKKGEDIDSRLYVCANCSNCWTTTKTFGEPHKCQKCNSKKIRQYRELIMEIQEEVEEEIEKEKRKLERKKEREQRKKDTICPHCKTKFDKDDKFCPSCSNKLKQRATKSHRKKKSKKKK